MENKHSKEEILNTLNEIEFGTVTTLDGEKIKSRVMHFAVADNMTIYLASIKHDPKVKQMVDNPTISLLLTKGNEGFEKAKEVEVQGIPQIITDNKEREEAFNLLAKKSPIVSNLMQAKATDLLAAIKITPKSVKYRVVEEIVRGIAPTVIEFEEKNLLKQRNYMPWEDFKKNIAVWLTEIRAPFLTATLIPVILGTAVAWARTSNFSFFYFFLTLIAALFLHMGTNVANDYFDHISKNDDQNTEYIRPFSGGSRMIQDKKLSAKAVLIGSLIFFGAGSLIGLYIASQIGWQILTLGIIGVISGFFYSAPPFKLAGRGIGEILVGLNFGILMSLGAYFVQTRAWSIEAAVIAIPVSLLIAAVLYINEFPDYTADKAVGKNTLVVRLAKEKAVWGYQALMLLTYIILGAGVATNSITPFAILGIFTLPRALRAIRIAKQNYNNTLYLIPANADTVLTHLYTGGLLILAYIAAGFFRGII